MNLMRFLLQSSRRTVIVATIAGAVAGATGIGLIAIIQIELARIVRTGDHGLGLRGALRHFGSRASDRADWHGQTGTAGCD